MLAPLPAHDADKAAIKVGYTRFALLCLCQQLRYRGDKSQNRIGAREATGSFNLWAVPYVGRRRAVGDIDQSLVEPNPNRKGSI
jgi:hypothetical protein